MCQVMACPTCWQLGYTFRLHLLHIFSLLPGVHNLRTGRSPLHWLLWRSHCLLLLCHHLIPQGLQLALQPLPLQQGLLLLLSKGCLQVLAQSTEVSQTKLCIEF